MAHIKENDLMLAFYLASPPLQKEILHQYQHLTSGHCMKKNLLTFLEEKFSLELTKKSNNAQSNVPHFDT